MYYGKMTEELKALLKEYENKFGYSANGELGVEYGDITYELYINDLKRCIETGVHIGSLYPDDDEDIDDDW